MASRPRRLSEPGEDFAEQRQGVVSDDHGNDERHGGVEPIPASGDQDDQAGGGDASRRGGIGDGIEEDRGDGQVAPVSVIIGGVGLKHQGTGGHGQRGHAAHDQHGQAVYLRGTREEPLRGGADHEHLENQ